MVVLPRTDMMKLFEEFAKSPWKIDKGALEKSTSCPEELGLVKEQWNVNWWQFSLWSSYQGPKQWKCLTNHLGEWTKEPWRRRGAVRSNLAWLVIGFSTTITPLLTLLFLSVLQFSNKNVTSSVPTQPNPCLFTRLCPVRLAFVSPNEKRRLRKKGSPMLFMRKKRRAEDEIKNVFSNVIKNWTSVLVPVESTVKGIADFCLNINRGLCTSPLFTRLRSLRLDFISPNEKRRERK